MKIGIIGSGNIGATFTRLAVEAGYQVRIANSRGPWSLAQLITELGPQAGAGSNDEVARFGEVILLAAPWRATDALPKPEAVAGKVVIDAMNPYAPDGTILDLGGEGSSEVTAARLPQARLVKAFNTIWYRHLAETGRKDLPVKNRRAVFLAGDDAAAKAVVAAIITEIGFAPVDTGGLREGGERQKPGSAIYNRQISADEAEVLLRSAMA